MSEWGMIMTNSKVHVGFLERDVKVGIGVLCSYALFYVLFFSPSIIDHKLLAPGTSDSRKLCLGSVNGGPTYDTAR
jgi:hypothetical protein